ncbi:MAG: hypothetical protein GX339_10660, partial [Tissierellia bacterium]|nr:hypothetical protein [Tissierellia bacterium]
MNFQSSHRFLLFAITPATFLRVFHYKKQPNLRLLIGCCLAVLIYLQVFHDDFYTLYQPYLFTVYHSSLELLGVAITWSIFAIAWYLAPREQQRRNLFMGLGFLIIGIMELFHILTYPGMPLSEVVAEGACMLFWYVGRLTLFLTLALALAIPVGSIASPRERNGGLFSSLLLAIGLIYFLPRLSVNPYLLYIPEMTNGYLNIVIELGL